MSDINKPLKIFQPMNIIVFFSFFSPVIIATSITGLSFVFQNFKGLIYLGFLVAACVVRNYLYTPTDKTTAIGDNTICSSVQYSKYGNPTFSAFVFAFTIVYLSIPMFSNGAPNLWVFISLTAYFIFDVLIKVYKKCIVQMSDLFLNILGGSTIATLIVGAMYLGGSGKFLFFNEVSSTKDVCYQPSKQTFKCDVYKDGELVSSMG